MYVRPACEQAHSCVGIMVRPCHAIDAGWIEADGAFYTRRLQFFVGFEKGYMGFEREKESSGRTYLKQDKPQHERAKLEGCLVGRGPHFRTLARYKSRSVAPVVLGD